MKILTRYILLEFLKPFLLATLGFSALILVAKIFEDINFILDNKPSFLLAIKYFVLQVPGFLVQTIPLAVLFGVLFSLSRLSRNSELMAMRSGGINIYLAAVPLFFAGVAACLLSLAFNETVVPKASQMVRNTRWTEIEKRPEASNKRRRNLSLVGAQNQVYYIGAFDGATETMTDVLILQFGNGIHLKSRLDARMAKFEKGQWVFYDGYLRVFDEMDSEVSAQSFAQMAYPVTERTADFLKEQKEPKELNLAELTAYIKQLKRNGADCHKEMVELHNKLALPFGCVILAILGVPWGWTMGRFSGVVLSFGICLLVAFLYLGGMQIGYSLGNAGVVPPFWAIWSVNILFAVVGPVLLVIKNR